MHVTNLVKQFSCVREESMICYRITRNLHLLIHLVKQFATCSLYTLIDNMKAR